MMFKQILNEEAMLALGAKMGVALQPGVVLYLSGSLGAGKTTLTRAVLQGLGYKDKVKSPTYTIVEPYHIAHVVIYHFDLYRLNQPEELDELGIHDYFTETAICIVEWPENGKGHLPAADLICTIDFADQARMVQIEAFSDKGEWTLKKLS